MKQAGGGVLGAVWTWEVGAVVLVAEDWAVESGGAVGAVAKKGTEALFSTSKNFQSAEVYGKLFLTFNPTTLLSVITF